MIKSLFLGFIIHLTIVREVWLNAMNLVRPHELIIMKLYKLTFFV